MGLSSRKNAVCLALVMQGVLASLCHGEPILQLYIEGATYDTSSETWVLETNLNSPIRLWTIGNINGGGGKGTIENVKLSVVYDNTIDPTFTFTPSTTGGFGGFSDTSDPSTPVFSQEVDMDIDDRLPLLGDGKKNLSSHGVYGDGREWQEFLLGNFDNPESESFNFDGLSTPSVITDLDADEFQINVYEITVGDMNATDMPVFHFDLYNGVESGKHFKFAPFSHDAGTDPNEEMIPTPSAAAMGLIALLLMGASRPRREANSKVA